LADLKKPLQIPFKEKNQEAMVSMVVSNCNQHVWGTNITRELVAAELHKFVGVRKFS
jgi:hypothetical protein